MKFNTIKFVTLKLQYFEEKFNENTSALLSQSMETNFNSIENNLFTSEEKLN